MGWGIVTYCFHLSLKLERAKKKAGKCGKGQV